MIHTAIRATQDNLNNYVDPKTDPAMFNVNVALLNIAKALLKLQNQIDDIQKQAKNLERGLDDCQSFRIARSRPVHRLVTVSMSAALRALRRLEAMLSGTVKYARRRITCRGKRRSPPIGVV
jgi:hypothetical protein